MAGKTSIPRIFPLTNNSRKYRAVSLPKCNANHFYFDKVLLSMDRSIGGLFLLVKGYYASQSRGWRCGWEREIERFRHLEK
jgi:hypothetical protein